MGKIDKYSKKNQTRIERFIAGRKEVRGDDYFTEERLISKVKSTFEIMVEVRDKFINEKPGEDLELLLKKQLQIWAISLRFTVFDYIFYERIINDNLEAFQNGLFTIQRILFLGDKCHISKYWDSYIMINLRGGMAYYDGALIEAYKNQMPTHFKKGHPFNITLANGLFDIFQGNLQEASDYLDRRAKMKTLTKYDKSFVLAAKAIADEEKKIFAQEIDTLLKLYPRQQFSNLAEFINLEAISLYNLAEKIWGRTIAEPVSEYWDSEFIKYNGEYEPKFLLDFSEISPTFDKWLKELPENLSMIQLIDEFERSLSS